MSSPSIGGQIVSLAGPIPADTYENLTALGALAESADGHPPFSDQTLVSLRSADAASALLTLIYSVDSDHRDCTEGSAVDTSKKNDGDAHPSAQATAGKVAGNVADNVAGNVAGKVAGNVAGMAVVDLDQGVMELVVNPCFRNEGVASELMAALRERGVERVQAWSHGDHPAAAVLAEHFGYAPVRQLWRMRLMKPDGVDSGVDAGAGAGESAAAGVDAVASVDESAAGDGEASAVTLGSIRLPDGVSVRNFEPGRDDAAWVEANALAFASHPEQGVLTVEDLRARMAEPWFDPAGFFVAEREGEIIGFHWTKVHPGIDGHPDVGEVYVVGVVPGAQGTGVGKALLYAGIHYLHQSGLGAIMLYVDASNEGAIELYRKLGFARWDVDVMYAPSTLENR